jgi:DNA polymerase III subunit alpha
MKPSDFVHLHCHSTYSLLEALPSPEEIVLRAKELGQNAVGLADKGYVYGLIEFYKAAKEHDIKPILGLETYIAVRTRHDKDAKVDTKRYPLTLLAETMEGYQNLLQLATHAALEGMYYKPRIDDELLEKFGKGLIALSGPIGGMIPQAALAEDAERMQKLIEKYRSFFGKENLYLELMDLPNVSGQAEVNQQLIKFGAELNVPVIATCNSHYCRKEDNEAHDVLLCIQKNANVHDTNRFSMLDSDFSMRPFEEMEEAFSHIPEALDNTRVIADRCDISFEFGTYHIPSFAVPHGETESSLLKTLCEKGAKKRYAKMTKEAKARLDYELQVIDDMGFSGYFLIVADFVGYAKKQGITVGPGRGSAAGSIVSYCLDITTLDPLEHGLLFERFLNPERVSMPDIDLDFADTRRDEVLEYVAEKYGRDHVVQICTFGTLAARAAVKDVGRAYGVPFVEMNELAKLIPDRPGTKLVAALRESSELKVAHDGNETYRKIIDTALKLEGKARHVSVHACGVVITPEPAVKYTAIQKAPKDDQTIITQYSAKPLEDLGLLKMDFLGLKNLSILQTTLEIIERLHHTTIDLAKIPLDDAKTYELLSRGDTTGVFQFESGGMRRYLKQLKPTRFEDLVVMVALYRPGPMDSIPDYIKRKNNSTLIKYDVPELKPFLEETYGVMVYQEQVQRVVQECAGFSLGSGYLLIKAVAKKIPKLLSEQKEKFLKGALKKGHTKATAERIFALIEPFSGYGFNKSHSAGYARIAYETAYLKANYPTEFMAAMLSADADTTDRIAIEIEECRAMGIEVLPPDINESLAHFTGLRPQPALGEAQGKIRFGLTAIKGVGESSVRQIIAIREDGGKFVTIEDFANRVPAKLLNKKLIEAFAKSGALDSLGNRDTFVQHYDKIAEFSRAAGDASSAQTDLFAHMERHEEASTITFPETAPVPFTQRLQWEKETLGLYVSSHPLAGLTRYIGKKAQLVGEFTRNNLNKKVTVAGIVEGVKKITTKKGDIMGIVFLEDPTGKIEITLFPRTYAQAAEFLESPDTVLVVGGTLDYRGGQMNIRADAIKKASLPRMVERAKKEGFFDEEEAKRGLMFRRQTLDEPDVLEIVDEEGNVVAGETVNVGGEVSSEASELVGDLASFIAKGMPLSEPLGQLEGIFSPEGVGEKSQDPITTSQANPKSQKPMIKMKNARMKDTSEENPSSITAIRIHTIDLPEEAPKQLLRDLKSVLERFPGKERIQLTIGSQEVPLPLTVTMSTILEKKIAEVMEKHLVGSTGIME